MGEAKRRKQLDPNFGKRSESDEWTTDFDGITLVLGEPMYPESVERLLNDDFKQYGLTPNVDLAILRKGDSEALGLITYHAEENDGTRDHNEDYHLTSRFALLAGEQHPGKWAVKVITPNKAGQFPISSALSKAAAEGFRRRMFVLRDPNRGEQVPTVISRLIDGVRTVELMT